MRLTTASRTALFLALAVHVHVHVHHHFRGPPIDYLGLGLAAAASWAGLPGPGEPVLIAGGLFAARHQLDIASVLVVAWLGATAGGVVGWLVGLRLGRHFLVARGPFRKLRQSALARGDEVFARYTVLAIQLTPSWVAGIHRVKTRVYLPINALCAALWAVGIGLAAFYLGPTAVDFVNDLGLVTAGALIVLIIAVVIGVVRHRGRDRAKAEDPTTTSGETAPLGSRR